MTIRILAAASLLGFATVSIAQGPPGTPVKSGGATLVVDGSKISYDKVAGTISDSAGFLLAGLTFGSSTGDNFQVSAMVKGPGAVDLNQPFGNGVGYRKGGTIFQNEKGKPGCTLTLTKITKTEIEGTASCPQLKEVQGSRTLSITEVKFSAKAS